MPAEQIENSSDRRAALTSRVISAQPPKNTEICEIVHIAARPAHALVPGERIPGSRKMIYGGFEIRSFEAGKGLWHARIQRADQKPVVIDGISFPKLEVGFAWSDPDAAVADAKTLIDQFMERYATAMPPAEASSAP